MHADLHSVHFKFSVATDSSSALVDSTAKLGICRILAKTTANVAASSWIIKPGFRGLILSSKYGTSCGKEAIKEALKESPWDLFKGYSLYKTRTREQKLVDVRVWRNTAPAPSMAALGS
jgi:hypothetical protein